MKKAFLSIIIISLIASCCQASSLYRIRFAYQSDKIRAVFDFDGPFTYKTSKGEKEITLWFKDARATYQIENYVELNDLIVKYFYIEKDPYGLKVNIPLAEPIEYNIFHLNTPPRLVIDFKRHFLQVVSGGLIGDGIELLKVKKGSPQGNLIANVLRIDLNKANIEPALAKKYQPNMLESFLGMVVAPWSQEESQHFSLDKVENIIKQNQALAGINGTFFARSGSPLGALIINGELVSSPIYDRTAFFIDEQNRPYIDNVFIKSYFELENDSRYEIAGINQGRGKDEIIIYTPAWGRNTGTNTRGIELVVLNSRVSEINLANSLIPKNGYVLSANGAAVETLVKNAGKGTRIKPQFKTITYNTSPNKIIHLVSGGPRLLKNGRIYISKHEEKFRPDVAKRRAGRTAVGITRSGKLLLVTVEKPSNNSHKKKVRASLGASLEELSKLMQTLGAKDAMNLDGGSSTTMVIKDKTVCGSQRKVSNAIIVRAK